MTLNETRLERRKVFERMKALNDLAAREKRNLTAAEQADWDKMSADVERMNVEIEAKEAEINRRADPNWMPEGVTERPLRSGSAVTGRTTFRDAESGQEIRAWRHDERAHNGQTDKLDGLVRIIRAKIDGRFAADLTAEERASSMGSDASGGLLVAEDMGTQLIAAARDAAPVASHCNVLRMPKLNTTLVGVDTFPTAAVQHEGETMTEGSITFHKLTLAPHRIGTYLVVTKELARATNFMDIAKDALRYAVAKALDRMILGYTPDAGVAGLLGTTGINTRALAGAAPYTLDNIITDFYQLRAANAPEPFQMFYNADMGEALSSKKDGEGRYILSKAGGVPDVWDRISRFETGTGVIPTTSDATDVFLGPFGYAYLGLENNWEVFVSNEGYDGTHNLLTQGKVAIRILGWADVAFAHASWFTYISGAQV